MTLPAEDPRRKRREAKIADIVEAAWSLVQRDGLGAISLRDLAAAVGRLVRLVDTAVGAYRAHDPCLDPAQETLDLESYR